MKKMFVLIVFFTLFVYTGCSRIHDMEPSENKGVQSSGNKGFLDDIAKPLIGKWKMIDIPGAYCSDGSQYKVFVMRSNGLFNWASGNDKKLAVFLEAGGACWDYESCSGKSGIRGATNPNGVPDNYMNLGDAITGTGGSVNAAYSPLILRNDPMDKSIRTADWNKVFLPYCTGDVHSGNKVSVYKDLSGNNPPLTYRHLGHKNIEKVIEYLKSHFYRPDELLVTGASAGGTGALVNYHFFRKALNPKKSYLFNDSGPVFSAPGGTGYQNRLHQKIKAMWNIEYLLGQLKQDFAGFDIDNDLGLINEALAQKYPDDILALTVFVRDAVYSMYSYARFYGLDENIPEQKEQVLQMWHEDLKNLMKTYQKYPNLLYFIPYCRNILSSHTVATIEFKGTEIYSTKIDAGVFIDNLLNKQKYISYYEPYNSSDIYVTDFWLELANLFM